MATSRDLRRMGKNFKRSARVPQGPIARKGMVANPITPERLAQGLNAEELQAAMPDILRGLQDGTLKPGVYTDRKRTEERVAFGPHPQHGQPFEIPISKLKQALRTGRARVVGLKDQDGNELTQAEALAREKTHPDELIQVTYESDRRDPLFNPPAEKREPLLADIMLAKASSRLARETGYAAGLPSKLYPAKRYVVDADGVQKWAEFIREVPEYIGSHQEFARPPFANMWVEFDAKALWSGVNGRSDYAEEMTDRKVGYLFDGGRVYFASTSDENPTGVWMPVAYDLHTAFPLAEQQTFCRVKTLELGLRRTFNAPGFEALQGKLKTMLAANPLCWLDITMWGSSYPKFGPELATSLRDRHRMVPLVPSTNPALGHAGQWNLMTASFGDLRNVLGLLLLLNQPSGPVVVSNQPSGRRFISGKLRPFVSHSTITVHLAPDRWPRQVPRPAPVTGSSPRRQYDMPGFWREVPGRGKGVPCDHHFLPDPKRAEGLRFRCAMCRKIRTRVTEHTRGNFKQGVVLSDYEVTR